MNGRSRNHSISLLKGSAIILATFVLLAACGGPQSPAESESEEPEPLPQTPSEVSLETAELVEAPTAAEAMVVFLSGEVTAVTDGSVSSLSIGDTLQEGAVIRVGETAYCEIQLGDRALLRVEAATQLTLERLSLSENRVQTTARVDSGEILSRVERLTGRDSFNVRTSGVVAGVRGTRFKVAVSPEGESTVAVEEGRVSLLPPELDMEVLGEQYGEETEILAELAPVVEASRQVTLPPDRLREVGSQLVQELEDAQGEAVRVAFESAGASLAQEVPPTDEINPESRRALREFGQVSLRALRTEAGPTLVPLSLSAEPATARIIVSTPEGRELVSRGSFSGLFEAGNDLSVTVRAEGYQSRSFDLTTQEQRGFSARVTLPEVPESESPESGTDENEAAQTGSPGAAGNGEGSADGSPAEVVQPEVELRAPEDLNLPEPIFLTLLTRPGRARIFSDGRTLGVGSAFVETEVGEELRLRAELEGYEPTERTVSITPEMEPLIELTLEQQTVTERIEVVTNPSRAQIFLNGEGVGRGRFSELFETGRQLIFSAEAEGYFEASRTITVRPGSGGTYRINLEEEPRVKRITLVSEPRSARITVNGEFAGRGSHTAQYEWGEQLAIELSAPGYLTGEESVTVQEDGPSRFTFSLQEEPQFATLTVDVVPGDGRISFNGREVGSGTVTREFQEGAMVTVSAGRNGFRGVERQVEIVDDQRLLLRLEPAPLERTVQYAGAPLIRGVVAFDDSLLFADEEGRVYRYTLRGEELWSYESKNSPNENSLPVVDDGRVYFTGSTEAVALSLESGALLYREPLGEGSSHLFGRTVTPLEDGRFLFPDNSGMTIRSGEEGSARQRVDLAEGARSSVARYGENRAVVVDQSGTFHLIDLGSGEQLLSVSSSLVQPVAARPALVGSIAVSVDRRGNGAAVNLTDGTLLWERKLSRGGLFSDPIVAAGAIYFTAGEELHAVDPERGEQLFEPLESVTTPPLSTGEALYLGRGKELLEVDPATGAVRRSLELPQQLSGRPAVVGERLVVGSSAGSFFVVNRTGWLSATSPAGD